MHPSLHHVGYAVPDLEAAVEHWSSTLGAGPFTFFEHVPLEAVRSRGDDAEYDHTAAFGMWGTIPVELLQVHSSAPTRVQDALAGDLPWLNHVAWTVPDVEAASAELEREGYPQFLEARLGDIHLVFHDARATHGHHFELHLECQALTDFWDQVRAAAA